MHHSFWDDRFSSEEYVYGVRPDDFLVQNSGHFKVAGSIADLGAGEGRNAVYLAGKGFDVTAVDRSSTGLDKTTRLAESLHVAVRTVEADALVWEPGEPLDGIVSAFLHFYLEDRVCLYRQIQRNLNKHGVFMGEWFHPDQRKRGYSSGGPADGSMMVTAEELKSYFADGTIIHLEEVTVDLSDGAFHRGRAAVTRIIWRKNGA